MPRLPRICLRCEASLSHQTRALTSFHSRTPQIRPRLSLQPSLSSGTLNGQLIRGFSTKQTVATGAAVASQRPDAQRTLPDLPKLAAVVEQTRSRFLSTSGIPTEQLTLVALRTCQSAALAVKPHLGKYQGRLATEASNLLALDPNGPKASTAASLRKSSVQLRDTANKIAEAAYDIIASETVVITPAVLELYVDIQSALGRPSSLAQVFKLFASKPLPKKTDSEVAFSKQNPQRASAAIEAPVAEKALDCAILAKDLDSALDIVEICYRGTAFTRQKLLRTALVPVGVVAAAPAVIYLLAYNFAHLHPTINPNVATGAAFAGILAYLGFTGSLGLVAKFTMMDHMKRVTWAPGVPLRERWMREEERAALDKISCAWGFQETWKHGEEVGPEWVGLREYIGLRGMVLDRIEFMEGMN